MRWSLWKAKNAGDSCAASACEAGDALRARDACTRDEVSSSLQERGITSEDAGALADRLTPDVAERDRQGRGDYLDGVAMSWHALGDARGQLDGRLREIREVERLMGAFTGELSKLDEVLEVLAAYVRRMRSGNDSPREQRTLH